MPSAHPDLWQRYQATKAASAAKYARDIATEMGISEAELTAARLGHDAVRLSDDARTLITALERVDETKCICRNEYAVHEQVGQFTHQHLSGHTGLVLNPRALDLRLFLGQWAGTFHLNDNGHRGIQLFNHHSDALLKVYAAAQTDMAAQDTLITEHRMAAPIPLILHPLESVEYADTTDDTALENDWRVITDVHRFFGLLHKCQLPRQRTFRLVSDDLAYHVDRHALPLLLEMVRQEGNEIMIFVGSRSYVQIFTDALEKLTPMRGWLNISDTTFTLHLREESLDEVWVTRKLTSGGHITSVELFVKGGTQIVQLYDQRSEGRPEQIRWRQQVDRLTRGGLSA